jgi:hypothetical protein
MTEVAQGARRRHAAACVGEPDAHFLGQWYAPTALRENITGNLESPVTIFWNIEKK